MKLSIVCLLIVFGCVSAEGPFDGFMKAITNGANVFKNSVNTGIAGAEHAAHSFAAGVDHVINNVTGRNGTGQPGPLEKVLNFTESAFNRVKDGVEKILPHCNQPAGNQTGNATQTSASTTAMAPTPAAG